MQLGNHRPQPGFGDQSPAQHAESNVDTGASVSVQVDEAPKDYSLSVDEIRSLLAQAGIEKSKDTIQRYCREGRLECAKLGLLRRYFATPQSFESLLTYLQTDAVEIETTKLNKPATTLAQVHAPSSTEMRLQAQEELRNNQTNEHLHEAAPIHMQEHAPANSSDMVEFLKSQIEVKDDQIKVKDSQIAAMLERDRETNFLIRELQTQLSSTVRLIAGRAENQRADVHDVADSTVGQ